MGAIFRLEHANIMAYVTSSSYAPPRVARRHFQEFLDVLTYSADQYLIPERGFGPWPREISEVARRASQRFGEATSHGDSDTVQPPTVARYLEELRSEFSDYPLYALAVGMGRRIREFARELASMPLYGSLLVLIPEQGLSERNFEVLDPVPTFSAALHAAAQWPGILFWTATGASAYAPLESAPELVDRLRGSIHERRRPHPFGFPSTAGFDAVLRQWHETERSTNRRLLQLSDLHFGTRDAAENQALLEAELRDIVRSVDRVVITGDLFDTPKSDYAALFGSFKNNITHLAGGREPIAITGNHDQRMIGLFGKDYEQVAMIGTKKIIVDDECAMVFVCFNSSEKGSFARGRIPSSQFKQLGGDYRALLAARPEVKSYLPIVLVHHHPFSFDVGPETWVQRTLNALGLRDESFLEMVNATDLHRWCVDWKIKTILHGHKHKARYTERKVSSGNDTMNLTAIGCGSSLGAEGSAVSYNMLEWEPSTQRWIASFYESVNGGAFREMVAAVSPPATHGAA